MKNPEEYLNQISKLEPSRQIVDMLVKLIQGAFRENQLLKAEVQLLKDEIAILKK